MRVAFLTHEPFYPPSGGGSAEAVYLAQEMVRRGHEVHLFCPRFPDTDAAKRRLVSNCILSRAGRWAATRRCAVSNISPTLFFSNAWLSARREASGSIRFSHNTPFPPWRPDGSNKVCGCRS